MSTTKLVKKLDAVFSKYIRWYYADANGYVECYTCNVQKPVKEMQCGHFQSRKHRSTRWHTNNCRPQCVKCNMYSQGEQYTFGKLLEAEIGKESVDEIVATSKRTLKLTKVDLESLIDYYTEELKKLTT